MSEELNTSSGAPPEGAVPPNGPASPIGSPEFEAMVKEAMKPHYVTREETASERAERLAPILKAQDEYLQSLNPKPKA